MKDKLVKFALYLWDHKETIWLAALTIYEGLKVSGII